MAKKMKKFFGDKNWYETLYRWTMDEKDIKWRKEQGEKINLRGGDTEFFLLAPPFHDSDINSAIMFEPWHSGGWDDTNLFIVDTEEFNWYKKRRI